MSDVTLKIDLVKLERFVYFVLIIALACMLIWPGFRDKTIDFFDRDNVLTGAFAGVADEKTAEPEVKSGPEAPEAEVKEPVTRTTSTTPKQEESPKETCNDNKKNQDETAVDCGGVCGGYWYNRKCNDEPMHECEENDNCNNGYICDNYKCVVSPFSGDITMSVSSIQYAIDKNDEEDTEDDTAKVTSFSLSIKNDQEDEIRSAKIEIFIWDESNAENYESNIIQATASLGTIDPGETFRETISDQDPYYLVTLPLQNLDLRKNLRVLLYDYKDTLIGNTTSSFTPK